MPTIIFSTVQYNYDMGAATRTEDPKGAAQTIAYDWVGRIDRVTNVVNSAYTRYVYPNSSKCSAEFYYGAGQRGRSVFGKHSRWRRPRTRALPPIIQAARAFTADSTLYMTTWDGCPSSPIRPRSIAVGRRWEMTLPGFTRRKSTTGKAGRL